MPKPRKRFGQNFLSCPATVERIVSAINPSSDDALLEIGPGTGALTNALISKVGTLAAIEIDRDLAEQLKSCYTSEQLHLHVGDVLTMDFATLGHDQLLRVVGNLPYNISSPLLFHLFNAIDHIKDMHFMLQLETAQRLIAKPNSKNYSRLSVMASYYVNPILLFVVDADAFSPPPKVTSAFVRLTPSREPRNTDEKNKLEKLTAFAFMHRRKQLQNVFANKLSANQFSALGINPRARVENLTLRNFLDMVEYLPNE